MSIQREEYLSYSNCTNIQSLLTFMILWLTQLCKLKYRQTYRHCMCNAKASHIFSTKNNGVFEILTFEILKKH